MSNLENKICQNCKKDFIIESEDFEFYEKIKVPAPTWCPECRMVRRMMWRNERALYKRKCDNCQKDIIAIYPRDAAYKIFCQSCWWGDSWEGLNYGREIDFKKPFIDQFKKLFSEVPRWNVVLTNSQDADFANFVVDSKTIYLANSIVDSENIINANQIDKSKDIVDSLNIQGSELSYNCINCSKIYNSRYLINCRECINSSFLFDCNNCHNCFMSSNLRNKEFIFKNRQLSKEVYFKTIKEYLVTGTFSSINKALEEFKDLLDKALYKYVDIVKSINSSGDHLSNCRNVTNCFYARETENAKYCYRTLFLKDSMDVIFEKGELIYEAATSSLNSSRQKFCQEAFDSYDVEYCNISKNISNCFACIGLRNKQYCILNKQYTPESYKETVERIKEHMNTMPYIDSKGRIYKYGEFFPPELSPFSYNETVAQEYFPLTKDQAIEQGYKWKDKEERNIQITITNNQLPDHIKDVSDSIVNEIIQCAHAIPRESASNNSNNPRLSASTCNEQCTEAFKIIKSELDFYRKMNLPLPRLCPNCRHYQRIKQRNPLKLWKRQCQCNGTTSSNGIYKNTITHQHGDNPCPNTFETTYSPDRQEIVYCEQCYNQEVV